MRMVCEECGYSTEDMTATVCANNPEHPPLTPMGDDAEAPVAADAPAPPPPAVDAPAEPVRDEAPIFEVPPLSEGPAPAEDAAAPADGDDAEGKITKILSRLRELNARKKPPLIVGVLGFSTTGKTWLIDRLKYELGIEGDYEIDPELENLSHNTDRRESGTVLPMILHRFSLSSKPDMGFYVLDVMGERFRDEMQRGFKGSDRNLLEAITLCNAYLFVIPATEYLFTKEMFDKRLLNPAVAAASGARKGKARQESPADLEKRNRQRYEQIEAMGQNLSLMIAAVSMLDLHGVDKLLSTPGGLERSAQIDHLEGKQHLSDKPAAYVMTMADLMQPFVDVSGSAPDYLKQGGDFDRDPLWLVTDCRHKVVRQMRRHFRWWKIDFATAFEGHPGGDEINYGLGHHGVVSLVDWFRAARRLSRSHGLARLGGSNAAILARRLFDRNFRDQWNATVAVRDRQARG